MRAHTNGFSIRRRLSLTIATLIALSGAASMPAAQETAWVVTTDYISLGRVCAFATTQPWTVSADLAEIPGDAIGRHHDGLVYIVGRGAANTLQVFDPQDGFALVHEFSLGSGRNLQDIAFAPDGTAYVSCYDEAVLLQVDVPHEQILATYSTAAFADADGLPETSWMTLVGDRLYIACQILDRDYYYLPTGPGQILIFDTTARQWIDVDSGTAGVQGIALQGWNPYTSLEIVPFGPGGTDQLRVGCMGNYAVNDGGVEAVDLAAAASLGFLVSEQELGGDVVGAVSSGATSLHVLVSDASFYTSLRRVDLTTGQVTLLDQGNDYVHADVAWDGGFQVFVADRTLGTAGLRVFDAVSGVELTAHPLSTGLAPFQIVWPEDDVSAVPPPAGLGGLRLAAPYPNPCNPTASLEITDRAGVSVQVAVIDLRGRRLARRQLVTDSQGRAVFRFAGRDGAGRPLAAGAYRITAQSPTGFAVRTVILAK